MIFVTMIISLFLIKKWEIWIINLKFIKFCYILGKYNTLQHKLDFSILISQVTITSPPTFLSHFYLFMSPLFYTLTLWFLHPVIFLLLWLFLFQFYQLYKIAFISRIQPIFCPKKVISLNSVLLLWREQTTLILG